MPYIKFTHPTYGQMVATVENWINYEIFDAQDARGDVWPVQKSDCSDGGYFEE